MADRGDEPLAQRPHCAPEDPASRCILPPSRKWNILRCAVFRYVYMDPKAPHSVDLLCLRDWVWLVRLRMACSSKRRIPTEAHMSWGNSDGRGAIVERRGAAAWEAGMLRFQCAPRISSFHVTLDAVGTGAPFEAPLGTRRRP